MTEVFTIFEIKPYTFEEFINTTTPFEYVYQFEDDPFQLTRVLEAVSKVAKQSGFLNFKKAYASYVKSLKLQGKTIFANATTEFEGQELEFNCGQWRADDFGVSIWESNAERFACNHPLMPVLRMVNIDTGVEKLRLAYRKGKNWRYIIADKKTLASASSILELANVGVAVNSENAKYLVRYLHDVESLNYDLIPEKNSVSRMGWIDGEGFSPYVDELVFDGDANFRPFFESVQQKGSQDKWMELARTVRKGGLPARIILAASFASALIKPLCGLPFFAHLWGGTEVGKAQPLDTKIITPTGHKLMRDICVGDAVIGQDGKPHKVTGVYPQGIKEIYEITFKDGTKTRCCKEHLWWVKTLTRKEHGRGFKVVSLEEMMKLPLKKDGYNLRIPIAKPIEYECAELPIDAYLLGALLGDGCLTLKRNPANGTRSIYFNNSESDVIENVNSVLKKSGAFLRENRYTTNQHVVSGPEKQKLADALIALGLNVDGERKFIPDIYKYAHIEDRAKLLNGLMDTDGTVNLCGSFTYSTGSECLAHDVIGLCQGLGYRATLSMQDRRGTSHISNGREYLRKTKEFIVRIWTDAEIFTSKKHISRNLKAKNSCNPKKRHKYDDLPIISIEPADETLCQCIMVDSDDHTYLCDDFIVTHNTVGLMFAASVWANPEIGRYIHTFNSTAVGREKSAAFVNSMPLILDELQIIADKKSFDRDIMMLAEGAGKTRGTKSGGIDSTPTWSNCIITSGEMPLTNLASGGGAVNRIVEIECKERLFSDPRYVADTVKRNHGFAGRIFVEMLQEEEALEHANEVYKTYYTALSESDTTEKQAMAAAIVLTADKLATEWVFKDDRVLQPEDIAEYLQSKASVSVNERAYEFLCEYVVSNSNKFCGSSNEHEVWGDIQDGQAYIIRSVFNRICIEASYNPTAFLSWAKDNRKIDAPSKGCSKTKRINGQPAHCIILNIEQSEIEETGLLEDIL